MALEAGGPPIVELPGAIVLSEMESRSSIPLEGLVAPPPPNRRVIPIHTIKDPKYRRSDKAVYRSSED